MRTYVIDTNLYIEATRSDRRATELEAFASAAAPALHLHSVVALELLAGATTRRLRRLTERSLIEPFERRRRVITPGPGSWKRAGETLAELRRRRLLDAASVPGSFVNDCLIAATARELGFVVVTANTRDFSLIAKVCRFDFTQPWPAP
jgi:predicted nucleic acid-binding protein